MAGTNRFAEGNIVEYDGMIGTVKENCNDFEYWEVEFKNCTRIIHYRDMVFLCENQAVYDLELKMQFRGIVEGKGSLKQISRRQPRNKGHSK